MDLFELVGKIAITGADEANSQIDSVADNAEKNALRICGAIEKIGEAALGYGIDVELPKLSVENTDTDFTDLIADKVIGIFSGSEDNKALDSENGIFDNVASLMARLESLKPIEISSREEAFTTENYSSTDYKESNSVQRLISLVNSLSRNESYSESLDVQKLLSKTDENFRSTNREESYSESHSTENFTSQTSNTSRRESYSESRSLAELVKNISERAELVNRSESLSESIFTTKNVTEISAFSDIGNLSADKLSEKLSQMRKTLKAGLPKISSIQLSELEKLYRQTADRWEKIGLTASVGMDRMAGAISEKIPLVRGASDAAARSAQQALYVDGTASGGYLMDTFRNGISQKALELYRSVSGIAQNISSIMSGITLASVSVESDSEVKSIPEYATGGIVTREHIARVGENGAEAIIPLEHNTEWIDRVALRMSGNVGNGEAVSLLKEIKTLLTNQKIYLDGRTLVGGIANEMDRKLGSMARLKGRG